jgi:hypothetical protein
MEAGLSVAIDKESRDHCVAVVKGTFEVDAQGCLRLAKTQRPLVYADEHYGDPASTSIRYECDFALEKPFTDVLVVGKAVAPQGKMHKELAVRLEVQGRSKDILVTGNRRWVPLLVGLAPSAPEAFVEMPLTYDRAFGGHDDSRGEGKTVVEPRNLAGVGFHPHRPHKDIVGTPLPNLEHVRHRIRSCRDKSEPIGFGVLGRSWKPRIDFAGTYDQKWLDETAPFLPADFDSRYFQSAPLDQQFPHFKGGEKIRCFNMAAAPIVEYVMPALVVPFRFNFVDKTVDRHGILDTVIVEPHIHLAMLLWRASVPLGKKLNLLQSIEVGENAPDNDGGIGTRNGKRRFKGIAATIRWLRQGRQKS